MKKLSPTETACLLAILIILAIGCERQRKAESSTQAQDSVTIASMGTISIDTCVIVTAANYVRFDTTRIDTASFIADHSEIRKDSTR